MSVQTVFLPGLSPLARGTLISCPILTRLSRFIPAGAGNTDILSNTDAVIAVYPRWRGEHVFLGLDLLLASGLSPLARGTLIQQK